MNAPEQLTMFEPEGAEALALLKRHARDYRAAIDQAEVWDACLCPGARDAAMAQAEQSFSHWLTFAILLDLERELAQVDQ